jgi:hypothetical protein
MTNPSKTSTDRTEHDENNPLGAEVAPQGSESYKPQQLTGLLEEMQALLTIMPSVSQLANSKVATEEEIEAQFDNMPI